MNEHMPSVSRAPRSVHHAGVDVGVLSRALIVLFLAISLLGIISPERISSPEARSGAWWASFFALFWVLAIVRLLRQRGEEFRWVEFLVLSFLIVALISTLNNGRLIRRGLAVFMGFAGLYLMAFHLTTSSRPAQTIVRWTWSLLAVFAGVVLISLCCTLRDPSAFDGFRFQGFTRNPNTLGSFAALLMTGAIARSLERGASYRLGWGLLGLVGGTCLFLTQSRTAILGSVAGLIVVALLRKGWILLLGVVLVLGLYV
jgi:hypothetical protein